MSAAQEDIDKALDDLEQEATETEETEVEAQDQGTGERPPGYKTYDEWVAEGKDPADYKGENAYKAEYERIQEIRDLKAMTKTMMESMNEWKVQQTQQMNEQIEQARLQAEEDLRLAKEDHDIDAALKAQDKLNNLGTQKTQPPPIDPVITEFVTQNPILDKGSDQFDQELFNDMAMIQGNLLQKLTGGNPDITLTPAQIKRTMDLAFKDAKELHADKFVSPRNRRQNAPSNRQKPKQQLDAKTRLKSVTGNQLNKFDQSPANDIYEMLAEKDPKMAEKFAQNVLGD